MITKYKWTKGINSKALQLQDGLNKLRELQGPPLTDLAEFLHHIHSISEYGQTRLRERERERAHFCGHENFPAIVTN